MHHLAGKTASTSADLSELCKTSLQLINRDRAQHQSTTSRIDRQQPLQLRDPPTSSRSASSSYNSRGQRQHRHVDIQMIKCNHDIEEEVAQHHLPDRRHHYQQDSQTPPGYKRRISMTSTMAPKPISMSHFTTNHYNIGISKHIGHIKDQHWRYSRHHWDQHPDHPQHHDWEYEEGEHPYHQDEHDYEEEWFPHQHLGTGHQ